MDERDIQPVPLRPPHRPVDRMIDPDYEIGVPAKKPPLPSDGRYDVASFLAIRASVDGVDQDIREGYL